MRVADWRKAMLPLGVLLLAAAALLQLAPLPVPGALRWTVLALGALATAAGLVVERATVLAALRLRQVRQGSHAVGYGVVVLALVGLLNFLSTRHSTRWDLSRDQLTALAPQTGQVLAALEAPVEGAAFFTPETSRERETFERLLREYRHRAAQLSIEVVDPDKQPTLAQAWEITVVPTVALRQGERTARFNTISEEEFTNALIRVTRTSATVIYFLTGHGERSLDGADRADYRTAAEQLRNQQFTVQPLNLAETGQVPADARAVVVAGPAKALLPGEVQMLDTWLSEGGRLFALLDPGVDTGLDALLARWGVQRRANLVVDLDLRSQLLSGSAFAPVGADFGFHTITEGFDLNTFWPLASALELPATLPEGVQGTALVRSTATAWGETGLEALRAGAPPEFDAAADQQGPVAFAVAVSRPLSPPEGAAPVAADEATTAPVAGGKEARLVVFGTSQMAGNSYFSLSGNGDLFQNAVSWLAGESDLISIRAKPPRLTPLTLTAAEARWYMWTLVIGTPVLIVVLGVTLWWRRRWL